MPIIRPSSDLRNSYNEISTICHETNKPIYITKNGAGDLAVMSIELYEMLAERYENCNKTEESIGIVQKNEVKVTEPVINKEERKSPKLENNHTTKEVINTNTESNNKIGENQVARLENSYIAREVKSKEIEKNYANKDNKLIKNNHTNRENKDMQANNIQANGERHNSTDTVFRKIDTNTKPIIKTEPESAHEILQEIEIEPTVVKKDRNEETTSKKELFRSLDTEIEPMEKKQTHVVKEMVKGIQKDNKTVEVKDIKNTDWIFEDLNKMLNDIKV